MNQKKKFLKIPELPGGNEAFRKFVSENLVYPASAIENRIQGMVHLSAVINDEGRIESVKIDKGLGFGCDEEALRLVSLVKYGGVKNKGVRLKTTKKFTIEFKLPVKTTSFSYTVRKKEELPQTESKKYNYQIKLS